MIHRKKILLIIFVIYVIARIALNLPALDKPRELADTTAYLRISREPIQNQKFWGDARPFVFPLLLKISQQDVSTAAALHLGFSILAWGFLALAISASFRASYLTLFSFGLILALSLIRHLASWDYVMMTESLSVTFFVLFLALGIWLTQREVWRSYKVVLLIITAFFLAFTRDTNAYLLVMFAGMLTLAVIFRWTKLRALILVASFLVIFFINNYTADIGGRWIFPLNNIVGKRILPDTSALEYFQSCGMPVTPELLALADSFANGQDRAFYESPALNDYRAWLLENGKSCYLKYLLSNPIRSIADSLTRFDTLIRFDNLNKFFARKYDPVIPYYLEPLIYPVNFILPLWVVLTAISLLAVWKRAWESNPLWGITILLCLPTLLHLFITWHGDAMASERHALSVGLQLALCFWMTAFLILEQFVARYLSRRSPSAT